MGLQTEMMLVQPGYETKPILLTIEIYAYIMKLQSESTLNVVSYIMEGAGVGQDG